MRRFISIATAVMIFMGNTAFAAPEVINKEAAKNTINISGKAAIGDDVSICIVNPGYELTDAIDSPAQAVQSIRSCTSVDGTYSFDIKMNVSDGGGGKYKARVNVSGNVEDFEFSFYPIGVKLNCIRSINSANSVEDLMKREEDEQTSVIERILKIYGLENDDLTAGAKNDEIALLLMNEMGNGYDETDADKMYNILKSIIHIAALNNSYAGTFDDKSVIRYPELLGVKDTKLYNDYLNNLTPVGFGAVKSAMLGKKYKTVSDARKAFEKEILLNLFINNSNYGNGHVKKLLDTYNDELVAEGFDISKLSKVTNKNGLYDALAFAKVSSLEQLATIFNNYNNEPPQNVYRGGSGSGSPKNLSPNTGGAPLYVPSEIEDDISKNFTDIDSVIWAKEAIVQLLSRGIINGRGNNIFDPNGTVTRAEFTKMIIGAIGIEDQNVECKFVDVKDSWAKPYVAAAAENGIVMGIDEDIFAPNDFITREQGAVICYRAAVYAGVEMNNNIVSFADSADISDWALSEVSALSSVKVINGRDNDLFAPKENLTRAEAAKIVYEILDLVTTA